MTILERYIIRELLKVFTICLMGFILVFLLVELTDKIKYYFEYNPPPLLMIKYFLVKIPGYFFFAIPLSILLGGMLSLFMMARRHEIIAMQANGVDALTVARPVVLVGLIASVALFFANETIIPWSNRYSEYIQDVQIAGKSEKTFFKRDQIWMRSADSMTHIRKFDRDKETLEQVTIVRWDENYSFQERVYADKAKWWGDHWIFYGVNRTVRTPEGGFSVQTIPAANARLDKPPKEFDRVVKLAKEMNLLQLGAYIEKLREEGHRPVRYLVDWHDKIAFPFVCLIMAALSVPFAVKANPRIGGFALGLVFSVGIAFSYWIAHTVFIALGHGGYIPPVAAGWAANTVFGLGAIILLLNAGT